MRQSTLVSSKKPPRRAALGVPLVAVICLTATKFLLTATFRFGGPNQSYATPILDALLPVGQFVATNATQKEPIPILPHQRMDTILESATTKANTTTTPELPTFAPTPLEINETKYDLIFWSEKPLLHENISSSDFMVTRFFWESHNPLNGWEEVVNVDFRLCNPFCPLPEAVFVDIKSLSQFKKNENRKLRIYSTKAEFPITEDQLPLKNVLAITFWSEEFQQHIPVPHYHAPSIHWAYCQVSSTEHCPKFCPQNHYHLEYPFYYDPSDYLCKASHPDAIPPQRNHAGRCNCDNTCFTPQANTINSTWPWKDAAEREHFVPYWKNGRKRKETTLYYRRGGILRSKSKEYQSYQSRFACPSTTSSTSIPQAIAGDYSHHLYFLPQSKLIFCGIPKVGMSEWVKFFRHVMGAKDYLSLPHYKRDRTHLWMSTLEPARAEEILNDPTWTKAVFIRNPLDRLLSAYMDKILQQGYTQKAFQIGSLSDPPYRRPVLSFGEFVDKIADTTNLDNCTDPTGLKACTDPHWKPQLMTCGLDYLLPKFDFVGNFDYLSKHTKILLERVGAWDKYGATFDDGKGSKHSHICVVPVPPRSPNYTLLGFNQDGPSTMGSRLHTTGSKSLLEQYYTPELIAKVRQAYALDFAVWDELSTKPSHDVANGKDLKVVQEYCLSNSGCVG